jgi:hypothetical protein
MEGEKVRIHLEEKTKVSYPKNKTTSLNDTLFNHKKHQIIIINVHVRTQLLESIIIWDNTETGIQS